MGCLGSVTACAGRSPSSPPRPTPLLTSRRHIDLQRVCSAIGRAV
ncbi:putative leader peptide [Streptomyces sp. NPDC001443]